MNDKQIRRQERAMLVNCIEFANEAHSTQSDRSKQPYIFHVLRVMEKCRPLGIEFACVGVLHDVVEDCPVEIRWEQSMLFHTKHCYSVSLPKHMLEAIDAISQRPGEDHEAYLARCAKNYMALLVKIADTEDNSSPARIETLPDEKKEEFKERYKKGMAFLKQELLNFSQP